MSRLKSVTTVAMDAKLTITRGSDGMYEAEVYIAQEPGGSIKRITPMALRPSGTPERAVAYALRDAGEIFNKSGFWKGGDLD